uniref:EGF-like domain-containing protein n=1 Tax=Trichobilharzia regenti TaxID=157069 RepID=A0AA85JTT7_TRIRE|nr:unnamed protein product [Trichobilharzia regenti]
MLFIRIAIFLSLPSFILPVRELKQPWRLYNITDDKRHVDNTSTVNDTKTEDDNDNNTGTDNDTSAGDNISTSDETSTSNDTVPTDNAAISVDTTTVTAEDTTPDIGTSNTTDTADDAITNIGASNTTLTIDDTITTTSSIETDEIYANDTVPDINKEIIKNFSMKLYPLENFTTPRNIRVRIENTDCSGDESAICGKEVTCKVNRMDGKNFKLPVTAYSSNSLILPHTTCSCEEGNAYGVEVYHEEKRDVYMKCYENNPCEQCDSQHTLQCIINDDNSATCVCETGYSEFENCKEVKNGCDKPHPAATLSGNEACLVNNSNVCQPKFDSYEYTCMCKEPYREDRRLSFPNCMINTTYCKSMICVGFQPPVSALIPGPVVYVNIDDYDVIEADDCRNTTCYCPDGWVGQHCTEPEVISYNCHGLHGLHVIQTVLCLIEDGTINMVKKYMQVKVAQRD